MNATLSTPPASPDAMPTTRPSARRSRHWADQITVYLPVLLMGLLALASYWLLRATPPPPEPAAARAVTSEPDYFMRRFSVKVFDANGVLINEVFGSEARHRPDTDQLEVDQARIRVVGEDGVVTTAAARHVLSNGARTEFLLEGDAVVVREGRTLADGSLAVVDYKTGMPPSGKMVEQGFALQLGLIGLIAQGGGMDGVSGEPARFEYWSLGRNKERNFGYMKSPVKETARQTGIPLEDFLDKTEDFLREAIARWLLGSEPFTARLNPDLPGYSDYDQLMRLDEWQGRERTGADGGEAEA